MKALLAALMIVAFAGSAYAQGVKQTAPGRSEADKKAKADEEKAIDRAYKSSINVIPEKQGSNDPWGSVRGSGTQASGSKSKQK